MFIYQRERERQSDRQTEWEGERGRERETQNQKQTPGSELSAQSPTGTPSKEPQDHDLS